MVWLGHKDYHILLENKKQVVFINRQLRLNYRSWPKVIGDGPPWESRITSRYQPGIILCFKLEANITVLLPQVQVIVSSCFVWWNNILVPQLFQISEWEVGHPDLKEGDLYLLHQKEGKCGIKGYKYCTVNKLIPSKDKRVHTVEVKYFNSPSKKAKFSMVNIRKLSLIPNLNL